MTKEHKGKEVLSLSKMTSYQLNNHNVISCEIDWVQIKLKDTKNLLIETYYMSHRNMKDVDELEKSLKLITKKKQA